MLLNFRKIPSGCKSGLIIINILSCLVLLFAGSALAESPTMTVRMGVYENAPKVYRNQSGEYVGIFPDIMKIIAKSEGWQIKYVPGSWTECLDRLEKGEIDVMVDVAYSKARAAKFDFSSEPVFINWATVYSQPGITLNSLIDLQDKKIAVMKGSIHTEGSGGIKQLLSQFNISSELLEVENYNDVFSLLDSELADAGVVNRLFGEMNERQFKVSKSSLIFNPRHLNFAFPKNRPELAELREKIDIHLKNLKGDPNSDYSRIIEAHLGGTTFKWKGNGEDSKIPLTATEQEWIKQHPIIKFGGDPEFHPFEYIDENGSYSGISSEYIALLKERLGLNLQFVPGLTWRQTITEVEKGEIDLLPCIGMTAERKSFLNYSTPYIDFQRVIITRSDTPFLTGIEDLREMKVAVQSNTSHEGYVREETDLEPLLYPTLQSAVLAVSNGRADAFIGNVSSATFWIRKLNLVNLKVAAPTSAETTKLYFAARKDWPELIGIINKGLADISDIERNEIRRHWVDVKYDPGLSPAVLWKYVTYILSGVMVIFLLFTLWNYQLKKEIAERKTIEGKLLNSVEFERFITEISSRFINLKPEEIDSNIEDSLASVASFVGVEVGFLLSLQKQGTAVVCTHLWQCKRLTLAKGAWEEIDPKDLASWLAKIKHGDAVFYSSKVADNDDCLSRKILLSHGIQSSLDVPRSYQGKVIGSLGLYSAEAERSWTKEEIGLLNLVGQIFTNALLRKEAESVQQKHAKELELKSAELERSQKALTYLLEDVNEAKNDLQIANEKLKELDRLKSMFIASMSHELRTPLNSIIGFTGIILQGMTGEINDEQKDQLQRVYGAAKHLLALITDVIDISKIEAGRVDVYAEEFLFDKVVDEAVSNIQTKIKDKGLALTLEIQEGVILFSDRRRVLQCVLNYLSNAVRYTEKGNITLKTSVVEDSLMIRVSDSGIGIKEEDIPRLFNSFIRLDSHLKTTVPGTGLGLYLTKKIVTEMLGGEVGVESTYGEGSTFTFRVPLRHCPPGEEP